MERLQKIIAASGYCSRRKAEELIKKGKVTVNSQLITELGVKANLTDVIKVEGHLISSEPKEYYLFNKPRGVISSVSDELDRECVIDFIDTNSRIYPVGRLDYDTTGIMILTNDGELTNALTHPKFNVMKTYIAKINGIMSMDEYYKIKNGVLIDGRKVNVSKIKLIGKDDEKNTSLVQITINEGRNHIIKRLFEKFNYEVLKLKREEYAGLNLGNLQSGEYRKLTKIEIDYLYNYVNERK